MEDNAFESFIDFCDDMEIVTESAEYSEDNKYPVFIVLTHSGTPLANVIKGVTKDKFSHSMISFNPELDPMYTFGTKDGGAELGFSVGTPDNEFYKKMKAYFRVYVMYVSEKEIKKIKNEVKILY